MKHDKMKPMERVMTALAFNEPDRVPFFLLLTMHGARALNMSIREYFSRPEYVIAGQLRLRQRYGHDCFYPFFYAPIEVEAWGGEVIFPENGPPNSGRPMIDRPEKIARLVPPNVSEPACLEKVLATIRGLKTASRGEVPIIGVAISPFSLPVMQMGFEGYMTLIYERPDLFWKLMAVNQAFCVQWANAQLAAGATAICYFDPLSSPTIIERPTALKTGFTIARKTLAQIKGPTVIHLASGRALPVVDDLAATGTSGVGVSVAEDLGEIKAACHGKLGIIGNLNGIEMRRWRPDEAAFKVREAISKAGPGGGFILADNHGEIPFQVPEQVLFSISETVYSQGRYPLDRALMHQAKTA